MSLARKSNSFAQILLAFLPEICPLFGGGGGMQPLSSSPRTPMHRSIPGAGGT